MNKNIDFGIDEKTAILIKKGEEEKEDLLCKLLHKLGAWWSDGREYIDKIEWEYEWEHERVYDVHGGVLISYEFYKREYNIIPVDEFFKLHEAEVFKIEMNDAMSDLNNLTDKLNAIHKNYRSGIIANNTVDVGMAKVTSISGAIGDLRKAKDKLNEI